MSIFNPGVPDILKPNAPGDIPEATGAREAVTASPFKEAQDVDSIIEQLKLDRPLSLYIPNREKYPDWEFRIINSIPKEIADAHNKGFKEVDDPDLMGTFKDLIAGHDKAGATFRPILCARPKKVGDEVRRRQRLQLRSLYAGMDPKNATTLDGKYSNNVKDGADASKGQFSGPAFRIKV